jgi:hypothetical protein
MDRAMRPALESTDSTLTVTLSPLETTSLTFLMNLSCGAACAPRAGVSAWPRASRSARGPRRGTHGQLGDVHQARCPRAEVHEGAVGLHGDLRRGGGSAPGLRMYRCARRARAGTHHGALQDVVGLDVLEVDREGLLGAGSARRGRVGLGRGPALQRLPAALERMLAPGGPAARRGGDMSEWATIAVRRLRRWGGRYLKAGAMRPGTTLEATACATGGQSAAAPRSAAGRQRA